MYACEVFSDGDWNRIGILTAAFAQRWMIECNRDGLTTRIVYVA